jgi:plasmid stabilization system protein ParE
MRIRWTPAAASDLRRISDDLKEHYPHYRQPTMQTV